MAFLANHETSANHDCSARCSREMPCLPRSAHKAPFMQAICYYPFLPRQIAIAIPLSETRKQLIEQ